MRMDEGKEKMGANTHKEILRSALSDPEVKKEYEELEQEFELRRALLYLRKSMNLTQKEVAEKVNTKQEYVSRIERGHVEVSVPYLARLVHALGADMEIVLKPRNGEEPIRTRINVR